MVNFGSGFVNSFIKLATLNLCLGLRYKKDLVKNILTENKIDILMMQETELENGFDCDLLKIPGYNLELGKNSVKVRVGTYINDSIKYKRREELEGLDSHITVFDIWNGKKCNKRLINIYRSFNPNGETAKELFTRQLSVIKNAFNKDTVLMGDLNLDYKKLKNLFIMLMTDMD